MTAAVPAVPAFAKVGGGPAFPLRTDEADYKGMTLLDYFAAKAMQALIESAPEALPEGYATDADYDEPVVASSAYRMADAMLKEREKWLTS